MRESIRLTGVLSIFFQEIGGNRSNLSDSIILSLSELHFTFQQLQFLLEDCTRDGARLWMLMHCELVVSLFRVLMRAVATALDVLPLGSIDVSIEARESIQLAAKQAWESRFESDPDDGLAYKDVITILSQFGGGIAPELSDLRRVLNHLGIRSWSECHKEIKFLDSEMCLERSRGEKPELPLLSSLIGFMSYCRGVLFDVVDSTVATQRSYSRCGCEVISHLNSDDFRCPISLEIMADPVTIATGHTYDRASIMKWFKAGNPICPKMGEQLTSTQVVPNLALKRLILQHCYENGIPLGENSGKKRDITSTVLAGSPEAEEATKMLANFLVGRLANGTGKGRNI